MACFKMLLITNMSAAIFYAVYKIHLDSLFRTSEWILYFSMSLKEAGEVVFIIIIFLVLSDWQSTPIMNFETQGLFTPWET